MSMTIKGLLTVPQGSGGIKMSTFVPDNAFIYNGWSTTDKTSQLSIYGPYNTVARQLNGTSNQGGRADAPMTTGRYYWEVQFTLTDGTYNTSQVIHGISQAGVVYHRQMYYKVGTCMNQSGYDNDAGKFWVDGVHYGKYIQPDFSGSLHNKWRVWCLDMDVGALWGSSFSSFSAGIRSEIESGNTTNALVTGLTGTWYPTVHVAVNSNDWTRTINFGRTGFTHTPPAGIQPYIGLG